MVCTGTIGHAHMMQTASAAEVARGSRQRAVLRAVVDSRMPETARRCGDVARCAAGNLHSDPSHLLPMASESQLIQVRGAAAKASGVH
jgi:hypothetical protein